MAAHLCCTADRCWTPVEPFTKIRLKAGLSSGPSIIRANAESRQTSARTEDLKEIQQLFNPKNLSDTAASTTDHRSIKSSAASSKYSRFTAFLKGQLSRQISRYHTTGLVPDLELIKRAKSEIRGTLLAAKNHDAGGYDSDAAVIEIVEEPAMLRKESLASQGRWSQRHLSIDHPEVPTSQGLGRLSISFTPPRISIGSRYVLRRSQSMSSIAGRPGSARMRLRLPSLSRNRENSYTWKRGVMESLHIPSPSTSALTMDPLRHLNVISANATIQRCGDDLGTKEDLVGELEVTPQHPTWTSDKDAETLATNPWSNGDAESPAWPKPSFDQGLAARFGNTSVASGIARPHFFGRPERKIGRAASTSAANHLYSMGISRHLRSTSSFSVMPATTPTRSQSTTKLGRIANADFATREALGTYAPKKDGGLSKYSTSRKSPNASQVHLEPRAAVGQAAAMHDHPVEAGCTTSVSSSSHRPSLSSQKVGTSPLSLSDGQSTDGLSSHSQNSSKVSRFKENLETPVAKRCRKRKSIVKIISRTLRHKSCSIETFDGAFDEPRRLQRALALTDRNDAVGLMAKAIREKQAEKSMLYLEDNKEAAKHEVFRQRSASFCPPRGGSMSFGTINEAGNNDPARKSQARSANGTFLRAEFSISNTTSEAEEFSAHRVDSTGHLAPEFKTSIFSRSPLLRAHNRPDSPSRTLSISVCPTTSYTQNDASSVRRPSFQLNDMPAIFEAPNIPIRSRRPSPSAKVSEARDSGETYDLDPDLGAWSRYPSQTRGARSGSAGARDYVRIRDFAYDVDPINMSFETSDGEKRKTLRSKRGTKKKKWTSSLPKSKSMTLGKEILKGYSKLFRTSSVEWLAHGKGHRSSISAGGTLEHPELELLPPIFFPMHSIADDSRSPRVDARLHSLDGTSDVVESNSQKTAGPGEAQEHKASCVVTSSYTSANDSPTTSALSYACQYESCVQLPPRTSHSATACGLSFTSEAASQAAPTTYSSGIDIPNLVDHMLGSRPSSNAVSLVPSPFASPIMTPLLVDPQTPRCKISDGRSHTQGVSSVTSIRASSMDLLKTLQEAEERERHRAFDDILGNARGSASDDHCVSSDQTTPQSASSHSQANEIYVLRGST